MAIKIQGSTIIDDSRKVINASHVGIGTTNPTVELDVDGNANISGIVTAGEFKELYNGQYWSVVTQADVGYGASQVPLNQYLGQLAFLDDHHPNGLRRDGASSDDVFVNSSGYVGIGSAQPIVKLDVDGNARITGILTVGSSSISIDGTNNELKVGTGVTIHHTNGVSVGNNTVHSSGLIGSNLNIASSGISTLSGVKISSGIVTAVSGVVTFYGDGSNLINIAPSGAIEGLIVKDQNGSTVGTAGSISTLSFEGSSAVTVTGTTGAAGIATVLISAPGELNDLSDATTSSTSLLLGTGFSSSSTENTVVGQEAGANINARKNTFVGYQAGKWMTYEQNTAIGNQALGGATGSTSNAYDCVAIGDRALRLIEDNAHFNTAVGAGAGYAVTSGRNNTLIGSGAGSAVTTGRDNVCIGINAGDDISIGEDNTCIGAFAGDEITTGSNNIVIGNDAAASSATVSNEITLGNSSITKFRIPGLNLVHNSTGIGIGSTQPTAKLDVNGTLNVSGISTFQSNVHFPDTVKLNIGNNDDLQIYHNGTHSIIHDSGEGNLRILAGHLDIKDAAGNNHMIVAHNGAAVTLYHNGSEKLATTGIGVSIVGTGNTATITGPSNLVLDPSPVGVGTTSGTVIILGDLQVDGTQTIINSTTLEVDDKLVSIAKSATNATQANGAGLEINGASATLTYASTGDKWVFNKAPYYNTNRLLTTADEGSGNGLDADTLDGLDSLSFLRSDYAAIKSTGDLRFNNNIGITFGGSDNSRIFHDGTDLSLDLTAYVTDFKIRDGTTERYTFTKSGKLSLVDVNASGISTLGTVKISSGIVTAVSGVVTYYGDGSQLTGINASGSPWITTGYTGIGTTSAVGIGTIIEVIPYDTQNGGTLSFEGSAGQLFSITNQLSSGSIFSVNDISGIPSIDVNADGTIQLAPVGAGESVGIGTTNPKYKLHVVGTTNIDGTFTVNGAPVQTGSGVASTITVADESSDTTCFPIFSTDATGNINPKTGSNLTFNSSTGTLGAGGLNISGIVTVGTATTGTVIRTDGTLDISGTVGIGTRIDIIPYDTQNNGTLSFEGSAGQLFSITNQLSSGSIFSVNDISGIPSIDVNADGTIQLAPVGAGESVGIGTTNPQYKLHVVGDTNIDGTFTVNGSAVSGGGIANVAADTNPQLGGTLQTNGNTIDFGDSSGTTDDRLRFGAGQDLQIWHNGSNSYITQYSDHGDLYLNCHNDDNDVIIQTDNGSGSTADYFRADGSTGESILYHYGTQKLATKSTGIAVSGNVEKYDTLVGSGSTTVVGFAVTVAAKSDHRYTGGVNGASTSGYYLDGIESPFLTFTPGRTYRFNQTDNSNSSHRIRFYLEADKTTEYTENVVIHGTAGGAGAFTQIAVTESTPSILYYQCENHAYMGNAAQTNGSTVVDGKHNAGINTTVPVHSLSGIGTETNIDVALVPKGSGAIIGDIPDGATTGGNKRGALAVDLQMSRLGQTAVASGNYSALIGGRHNTASGNHSFIGGSYASTVSGDNSAGFGNHITVSGNTSYAFGLHSLADSDHSIVLGGEYASTRTIKGLVVIPACGNPQATDQNGRALCQKSILNLYAETADANSKVLISNNDAGTGAANTTNQLTLKNNSAITFKATCVAGVTGAGNTKVWELRGALKRGANAGSTALVGSVIKDVIAYDSGAAAWDLEITADTTNGAIKVEVTGQAATTIRWVCTIEATEMSF